MFLMKHCEVINQSFCLKASEKRSHVMREERRRDPRAKYIVRELARQPGHTRQTALGIRMPAGLPVVVHACNRLC